MSPLLAFVGRPPGGDWEYSLWLWPTETSWVCK